MTEPPETPPSEPRPVRVPPARTPEQTAKAERLAKALRDNLRRRKAARPVKPGN